MLNYENLVELIADPIVQAGSLAVIGRWSLASHFGIIQRGVLLARSPSSWCLIAVREWLENHTLDVQRHRPPPSFRAVAMDTWRAAVAVG